MKILIDINHPAHAHLFRHVARGLMAEGHEVLFTTREKEVALDLLKKFELPTISFGRPFKGIFGKLWGLVVFDIRLLLVALRFKPDLFLSMGSIYGAHVAFLLRKPHIALDDTEHAKDHHILYVPFTTVVLSPSCFEKKFSGTHLLYRGYHELAYLHPNRFTPDPSIYELLGLARGERFVVLRFVSWDASHDLSQSGLTLEVKERLVESLSRRARVFISAEGAMPTHLEQYRFRIPPDRMHDALAFADLFVGEGATMASEAAVLGTPAIYVNSLRLGYIEDEARYGLLFSFRTSEGVLEKAEELIDTPDLKRRMQGLRQRLLSEKIDVTEFLLWFVRLYPESVRLLQTELATRSRYSEPSAGQPK